MVLFIMEPTDNQPDRPEQSRGEAPVRKVTMLDPGFRESPEESVLRPRILGIKPPSHPKDRKNLFFLAIALLVALAIFILLEFKQIREAAREAKHSAKALIEGN
jgi:hypothetical protein